MNDVEAKPAVQTVNVQCDVTDVDHLQQTVFSRYSHIFMRNFFAVIAITAACAFSAIAANRIILDALDINDHDTSVILFFALAVPLYLVVIKQFRYFITKDYCNPQGSFLSCKQIELTANGLRLTTKQIEYIVSWSGVLHLKKTKRAFLYFVDNMQAIYIPKRCFATPEAAEAFHRQAEEYWKAAQVHPATGTAT